MIETIQKTLRAVEFEQGFRVLYACESGSRAWGFASRDSDFDVRFIYVWPRDDYLKVHLPPEYHHEDHGDLDLTGWDLRKALHHFGKSNAAFYEWLNSPVVYFDDGLRIAGQNLMSAYFQPRAAAHHYLGLARHLWPLVESENINGKKLLYVLRATLAVRWILQYKTAPPVPFGDLLSLVQDENLRTEIASIVEAKKAAVEADLLPTSFTLRDFVVTTRANCEAEAKALELVSVDFALLDNFCVQVLAKQTPR